MKVPAIRITEAINGSSKTTASFLFKLLNELRLRVEITSPK